MVATSEDRGTTELSAGRAGAALLARVCTPGTVLGISWGISMRALADATLRRAFRCSKVVPLVGGMGKAQTQLHSNQVCADLAEKLGASSACTWRAGDRPVVAEPVRAGRACPA